MYPYARIIAYEVPTVLCGRPIRCGWDPGNVTPAITDLEISNPDMKVRLTRLLRMVEWAYDKYEADQKNEIEKQHPEQVLKIFVAPEFYFRPAPTGTFKYGAYSPTEFSELLRALKKQLTAEKYQHWLIVCGTALTYDEYARTPQSLVYNRALVIRGGAFDQSRFFSKVLTSGIDGVEFCEMPDKHPQMARVTVTEAALMERILAPLGIGMEICLDHGQGILQGIVEARKVSLALHILIAGGMPMNMYHIAVPINKHFFRNDGMSWHKDIHPRPTPSELMMRMSTSSVASYIKQRFKVPGNLLLPPPTEMADFMFEQCISIYPIITL